MLRKLDADTLSIRRSAAFIRVLGIPLLLTLALPHPGKPQTALPVVTEGSRVRVESQRDHVVGDATVATSDSLVLRTNDNALVTFHRDAVEALEISMGRKRNTVSGLLWGGGAGLLLGTVAVISGLPECGTAEAAEFEICEGDEAWLIAGGALGGMMWGALIGTFIKTHRWTEASLPAVEPMVSLRARKNGRLAVEVSLRPSF